MSPSIAPPSKTDAGHLSHRVRSVSGQGQLVIGLLVGASISRGSGIDGVCNDEDVVLSELGQPVCRTIPGRSGPDNDGVDAGDRDVEPGKVHGGQVHLTTSRCACRRRH